MYAKSGFRSSGRAAAANRSAPGRRSRSSKDHARVSGGQEPKGEVQSAPILLLLPWRDTAQQRAQLRPRRGRIVECVQEGLEARGIEHEKPLIEQHVDGLPSGALDHELGTRLAEDRRRIV